MLLLVVSSAGVPLNMLCLMRCRDQNEQLNQGQDLIGWMSTTRSPRCGLWLVAAQQMSFSFSLAVSVPPPASMSMRNIHPVMNGLGLHYRAPQPLFVQLVEEGEVCSMS